MNDGGIVRRQIVEPTPRLDGVAECALDPAFHRVEAGHDQPDEEIVSGGIRRRVLGDHESERAEEWVADRITRDLGIPFIHLADVTADAVLDAGLTSVGLLGTRFTMDQPFYREHLEARGLTVLLPEPADRAIVNAAIYDELVHGEVREESRAEYQRIIAALTIARSAGSGSSTVSPRASRCSR